MPEEDSRLSALRARGKQKLGDELFEPILQATRRACQSMGISEQAVVESAMARQNGFELLETAGVEQLATEASNGDKESEKTYTRWYHHTFPNSRKARWARGER